MRKRVIIILSATILGGILGYFLAEASHYGWFTSSWERLESPPEATYHIVAANSSSVWISAESGSVYQYRDVMDCQSGCWEVVSDTTNPPLPDPYFEIVKNEPCAPSLPLSRIVETKAECGREGFREFNTIYALRDDRSLFLWKSVIYMEWYFLEQISYIFIGAIALFIPTILVLLFDGLLKSLRARATKQREME
jgi:hypothetical protein